MGGGQLVLPSGDGAGGVSPGVGAGVCLPGDGAGGVCPQGSVPAGCPPGDSVGEVSPQGSVPAGVSPGTVPVGVHWLGQNRICCCGSTAL